MSIQHDIIRLMLASQFCGCCGAEFFPIWGHLLTLKGDDTSICQLERDPLWSVAYYRTISLTDLVIGWIFQSILLNPWFLDSLIPCLFHKRVEIHQPSSIFLVFLACSGVDTMRWTWAKRVFWKLSPALTIVVFCSAETMYGFQFYVRTIRQARYSHTL